MLVEFQFVCNSPLDCQAVALQCSALSLGQMMAVGPESCRAQGAAELYITACIARQSVCQTIHLMPKSYHMSRSPLGGKVDGTLCGTQWYTLHPSYA